MDKETEQKLANTVVRQQIKIQDLKETVNWYERDEERRRKKQKIVRGITYIPRKVPPLVWSWFGLCIVLVGMWIVRSHYEAKTYNEITGKNITTRQALWVQLRVQEPARQGVEDERE